MKWDRHWNWLNIIHSRICMCTCASKDAKRVWKHHKVLPFQHVTFIHTDTHTCIHIVKILRRVKIFHKQRQTDRRHRPHTRIVMQRLEVCWIEAAVAATTVLAGNTPLDGIIKDAFHGHYFVATAVAKNPWASKKVAYRQTYHSGSKVKLLSIISFKCMYLLLQA